MYEGTTECNYDQNDDRGEPYFSNFNDFVDNNTGHLRGVHLGVTNHTNYAEGERLLGRGESGFNTCTKAFVGTKGAYGVTWEDKKRWANLAIQEPCHNLIYKGYHNLTDGNEHDLGMITGSGDSTPMLTFYERDDTHPNQEEDRSGKGVCTEYNRWGETHTQDVTDCTISAISKTADEEA